MANIVSAQDFKGMIMLPQINAIINTGVASVNPVLDSLTEFIIEKEPEVLTKLLGFEMYNAMINALNIPDPAERWINLRDGVAYTVNGISYVCLGVKPIILRYVYYWWLRQEATQTTGVGEAINKTENAQRTSPAQKQTTAWNDMVKLCKSTYHYLYANLSLYPEFHVQSYDVSDCYYLGYTYRWRRNELFTPINALSI